MSKYFTELGLGTPEAQPINSPENSEAAGEKPAVKEDLKGQPKSRSRRDFLKGVGAVGATVVAGGIMRERAEAQDTEPPSTNGVDIIITGKGFTKFTDLGDVKNNFEGLFKYANPSKDVTVKTSSREKLGRDRIGLLVNLDIQPSSQNNPTDLQALENAGRSGAGQEVRHKSGKVGSVPAGRILTGTIDSINRRHIEKEKKTESFMVVVDMRVAWNDNKGRLIEANTTKKNILFKVVETRDGDGIFTYELIDANAKQKLQADSRQALMQELQFLVLQQVPNFLTQVQEDGNPGNKILHKITYSLQRSK